MLKTTRLASLLAVTSAIALGGCNVDVSFSSFTVERSAGLPPSDLSRSLDPVFAQLSRADLGSAYAALPKSAAPAFDRATFDRRVRDLGLDSLIAVRWTKLSRRLTLEGWHGELHGTAWRQGASPLALTARLRHTEGRWVLSALDGKATEAGEAPVTTKIVAPAAVSDRKSVVHETMVLFIAAVRTKNAAEMHGRASSSLKRDFTVTALDAALKPFYDNLRVTGNPLAGRSPEIVDEKRDARGHLLIEGHYALPDSRITFRISYVEEGGRLLMSGFWANVTPQHSATDRPRTAIKT